MVLQPSYFDDAQLLERPSRELLSKFLVSQLAIKPSILQHLDTSEHSEASTIASLVGRYEGQLLSRGEQVVHAFVFRVGAVGGAWCTKYGHQQGRGCAERLANGSRNGNALVRGKVVPHIWPERLGRWHKDHVMGLARGGIVIEVVDNDRIAVGGKVDIQLQQQ
jgi:hypothetical protein